MKRYRREKLTCLEVWRVLGGGYSGAVVKVILPKVNRVGWCAAGIAMNHIAARQRGFLSGRMRSKTVTMEFVPEATARRFICMSKYVHCTM